MIHASTAAIDERVRERRSIRCFAVLPIPRAEIEDVLRLALWAPSPHNSQPWRFTVLFDREDRERLGRAMAARLADELRASGLNEDAIARQTERSHTRISDAPVLLLCSLAADGLVEYPDERMNALEWQMAVQSVGAVLQTVFLLAAERGIGSCWMAAPMYCPDVVREVLDLPAHYHPQALALLGYPLDGGRIRPRRSFHEVVDLR